MANGNSYPQLPGVVWKGVWGILNKAPSRKLDESSLSAELGVQTTAAKQYLKELIRLGILAEDGTLTELGRKWRQDGDDPDTILHILKGAYPEALLHLAPPTDLDRKKITRWFMNQNLGQGSAKNRTATYINLASGISAIDTTKKSNPSSDKPLSPSNGSKQKSKPNNPTLKKRKPQENDNDPKRPDLHVNIQIHIAADASTDQIDAIFSGMRKYFDHS